MLTLGAFNEIAGIRHGFFTREGGVSEGVYASLNCGNGSRDDPARVAENRARAMAALDLGPEALVTAYQVHSARARVVERPWAGDARPKVDAMATRTPGLALGVLTADCAPVLLVEPEARVVGAAHAGWRGALAGVLEAAVEAMETLGARRRGVRAGIGPCIGRGSYEVGPEFPAPFLAESEANGDFFAPAGAEGRFLFDLRGYVARRLAALGLGDVQALPCDTCAEAERFFSYRRAVRDGEADYGRGLSAVCLEP